MSNWAGGKKGGQPGGNWARSPQRGKKSGYGWQQKAPSSTPRGVKAGRRREWAWGLYSVAGAALLFVFLYTILYSPGATPVLMVTGLDYQAPMPPNAWAAEDGRALASLGSLEVDQLAGDWTGPEPSARAALRDELARHKRSRRGFRRIREPLVVYFSMPGAVDERGRPCLVPPGASPLESDDWIPVEGLIRDISDAVPADRKKLLVLDGCQQLVNWNLGVAYNTFAARVKRLVPSLNVENLAVLLPADEGQESHAAAELGETVFGKHLSLGLAGAADAEATSPDDEVSLAELQDYLRREVDAWARFHRGARQQPCLIFSGDASQFHLTHANPARVKALRAPTPTEASVPVEKLAALWKQLDRLRGLDVLRFNPLQLRDYEHRLLRLEQLAYAGQAYREAAARDHGRLEAELASVLANADKAGPSLSEAWGVTNRDQAAGVQVPEDQLHDLALRRYLASTRAGEPDKIERLWSDLASAAHANGAITLAIEPAVLQAAHAFAETQLLAAAHQQRVWELGTTPAQVEQVIGWRLRSDRLAAPGGGTPTAGDERAHYYVRHALAEFDRNRRLAEDLLFIGNSSTPARAWPRQEVEDSLTLAETVRDRVTNAYAVSDRVSAEAPYLAAWLCGPAASGAVAAPGEVDTVLRLLEDNRRLADTLAAMDPLQSPAPDLDEATLELQVAAENVARRHAELREAFDRACRDRGLARDGDELSAIDSVLRTPLIKGDLREDLLKKRDAIARELSEDTSTAPPAGDALPPSPSAAPVMKDALDAWSQSPLVAVLAPYTGEDSGGAAADLDRLERQTWDARRLLRSLARPVLKPAQPAAPGASPSLDDRQELSRLERQIRAAASLAFPPPNADPVARLRRFDVQQLMLWHGERALDDFWHTATPEVARSVAELLVAPDPPPRADDTWFATASRDYANVARQIEPMTSPGVALQQEKLERLLDERVEASRHGLRIAVTSRALLDAPQDSAVDIVTSPDPLGPNLPAGLASVAIADGGLRMASVSPAGPLWGSVETRTGEGPTHPLSARIPGVKQASVEAVAFFRGRAYRQPFSPLILGGAVVSYVPPTYDRQSVTLFGNQPVPPSVVFILDCSYSMSEEIEAEGPGSKKQSRMKVAVSALETMLEELASRQASSRPRVGVRFFGHRVGWRPQTDWQVQRNPNAADRSIPQDLSPGEDVERVLSLGDFNAGELGYVSSRLNRVSPLGITPVNLAIVQSLREDFRSESEDAAKSIIVITDGMNNQEHSTRPGFRPLDVTTWNEVTAGWDALGKQIPVYIVGFGIPDGERSSEVEDFQKIAGHTGGRVIAADSGGELIDYLRSRLDINGYVVRDALGRPITRDSTTGVEKKVELNTQVAVPMPEDHEPLQVEVAYRQVAESVRFEGGEALALQLANDDEITHRPYRSGVVVDAMLRQGVSGPLTSLLFQVHRPTRQADGVHFRVSVQDQEAPFTPRPKELWVEFSPDGSAQQYVFYDAVYEPDTPAPVASFTASGWPLGNDVARVRVWCSDKPTQPVQSIPLSEALVGESRSTAFQAVPSVRGVEVRVGLQPGGGGRFGVMVEERLRRDQASIGAVRVLVDSTDRALRPASVSHRFDPANGVAQHLYQYATRLNERQFAQLVTVQVASGEEVKKNARQLPDAAGLRARIVSEDATHAPTNLGGNP